MPSGFRSALLIFVLLLVGAASLFRVSDLDFWWHLKTGQIILEQKSFQHTEIYSFTANGREYVDHEWLFQVLSYLAFAAGGTAGVIFMKAAILALIYLLAAQHLLQKDASAGMIAGILMVSVCGGVQRFIERPEVFSTLYLVLIFLLLDGYARKGRSILLALVIPVILIWANTHAAVILGLLVQAVFVGGLILERILSRFGYKPYYRATHREILMLAGMLVVSFLVTGINPDGFRMLKVPFELTGIIDSGLLNNEEWQRTLPGKLPLFYLCLLFTLCLHLLSYRRISLVHGILTLFFGYIAIKYVRNTGMFAMFMPFLVAPIMAPLSAKPAATWAGTGALLVLTALVLTTYFPFERGLGIDSKFPEKIARFAQARNLQGQMLNSYGFGGYLIWRLYPQRKVFIDGRNEVYLPLMKKIVEARADSRLWKQLLDEYQIEYALLNYVDDLEKVTMLDPNHQAKIVYMPFTSTHFPRIRWMLVYFDDTGMVLIRKNGLNQNLQSLEYASVYPEGKGYQESLVRDGKVDRGKAIQELQRKLAEDPACLRAQRLLHNIQKE